MPTHVALTDRDVRLVIMLARGHTTDRVARELRVSRHTVGERISVLLGRSGCRNRTELVAYCYAHGLLAPGIWPPDGVWRVLEPEIDLGAAAPNGPPGAGRPWSCPAGPMAGLGCLAWKEAS